MTTSKTRLLLASLGGLAIAGGAAGGVLTVQAAQAVSAAPSIQTDNATRPAPTSGVSAPADSPVSLFKDGVYESLGRYLTPGGNESIMVRVHVRGGVVTAASSQPEASSPTARQFQEQFRGAISDQVVARPLASLSVDVVAGASLTSTGFNDALNRIRAEAER